MNSEGVNSFVLTLLLLCGVLLWSPLRAKVRQWLSKGSHVQNDTTRVRCNPQRKRCLLSFFRVAIVSPACLCFWIINVLCFIAEEYSSVASTPDSTPPCTDGGNEESELYELQTAREWSEDEDLGDGDIDEDEGLGSSPSIWGTPRQNSFELSFSYFAIAEAEAAGASRHHRDRRRTPSRSSRASPMRADTLEMPLDSPDPEWDRQAFLGTEDGAGGPSEGPGERERRPGEAPAEGPFLLEQQGGAAGAHRPETEGFQPRPPQTAPSPQHEDPTQSLPGEASYHGMD
ncbi:hypothetical protein N1851_010618 [Merluccius polli]|uniref:Uncharacterized protein n=1 Tax=Merluccius polli TaxID=89951 RepID=A0AA47MYK8_MERPO|nr:hypothetical protein N1851_010618 [Merluccius polli]